MKSYFHPLSFSRKHQQSNKLILSFKTRFSFTFLFSPLFFFSFSLSFVFILLLFFFFFHMNSAQTGQLEAYRRKQHSVDRCSQFSFILSEQKKKISSLQDNKYLKVFNYFICWNSTWSFGKASMTDRSLFPVCSIIKCMWFHPARFFLGSECL